MVLTPPGPAAIAVVRLVGQGVTPFLQTHFSKPTAVGRCIHGILCEGARIIDDPVVVLLSQDMADINLHGGPWVVQSALHLAALAGFEVNQEMDCSADAHAADGRTMLEREVHISLSRAPTELGLQILLAQPQAWKTWISSEKSREQIRHIIHDKSLYYLLTPPVVAIVGLPNVGKSTLANQLFGRERSITADLAGTTRDWVGAIANINGLPVMLMDMPGMRPTDDAIEQAAIEQSITQIQKSELIILVLDAARPDEPEQLEITRLYPHAIRVVNKSDKTVLTNDGALQGIKTVATTGVGIETLRSAIANHFGWDRVAPDTPRWWTPRQRNILERALSDSTALAEIL